MKYGIVFANTMHWTKGAGAIDMARAADDAGFESLWTVEHVVYPDDYSSPYPYSPDGKMPAQPSTPIPIRLIWLALRRVGHDLDSARDRHPDPPRSAIPSCWPRSSRRSTDLSGGRVELGIGVGWLRRGVRRARRPVGAPRRAHRRVRRGHASAVGLRRCELRGRLRLVHTGVVEPEARPGPDPDRDRGSLAGGMRTRGPARQRLLPRQGIPRRAARDDRHRASDRGRRTTGTRRDRDHVPARPAIFGDDPVGAAEELASSGSAGSSCLRSCCVKPTEPEAMEAFAERVIDPTAVDRLTPPVRRGLAGACL